LCLREILLKLKQHLGVGSAPAIDRVMRHDAIGNEVMRLLNIEVVDRSVQRNGFYLLDRVVPPLTVEEQHTAAHRCCGQKGQGVTPSATRLARFTQGSDEAHGCAGHVAESLSQSQHLRHTRAVCLKAPARRTRYWVGALYAETKRFQCVTSLP